MQALVIDNHAVRFRTDYPYPILQPGEALLRIRMAGICGTDLEIVRGYAGFSGVLGHEFVADVEAVADQRDDQWVGRRVVGSINVGCGECTVCRQRGPEHCRQRAVVGIRNRDGAFADYLALPVSNLVAVPDGVPDERAVFCEPLAAAVRIRQQMRLDPTARVGVIGVGRLGMLVGQVLALDFARVQMLGRREETLTLARKMGLDTGIATEQPTGAYDVTVECTGSDSGLAESLRLVRALGTIVMKSTYAGKADVDLTPVVVNELTLIGSRCGPFGPAMRLLDAGALDVESLIDECYPLAEGPAALERALAGDVRKVLIIP